MSDHVTVLLSTYNGQRFLADQLASFVDQTHDRWCLRWRDDGSADGSRRVLDEFARTQPAGRCAPLADDGRHRGIGDSFLSMLRHHVETGSDDLVAFADQDDVWLPEKLARAVRALDPVRGRPTLYCARQMLVDERGRTLGPSPDVRRPPAFPAALAQNIATGCTVLLNARAARLVTSLAAPARTLHDWWSYLVVTAAGGEILVDGIPVVLYRQHGGNAVGAARTKLRRGASALRRGPVEFMGLLHRHVAALGDAGDALSPASRERLAEIDSALRGGLRDRARLLRGLDLDRQTWSETTIFKLWFLVG